MCMNVSNHPKTLLKPFKTSILHVNVYTHLISKRNACVINLKWCHADICSIIAYKPS